MSSAWDRRSADEHERARTMVLEEWLPAATTFSHYWRRRVSQRDGTVDSLEDLRAMAPVRELDLLADGEPGAPGLLLAPDEEQLKSVAGGGLLLSIARAVTTGGTQGKQRAVLTEYKPIHLHQAGVSDELAIAYSRSDLDRLHRCGARAARLLGLDERSYLVSAVPPGPHLGFWGVYHLALGTSMLALHPRGAGAGLEQVVASLSLVPTTVIAVPLREAVELAEVAARWDADCGGVGTVLTVGPPPDETTRGEIGAAWRRAVGSEVTVRAVWAPTEARALWAECAEGTHGLHTYPDLEVLEVLDPVTGEASGGDGDLTYTSAGWHGTGLLRYQTGTWVERLTDEPCPGCGRTVPRLTGEIAPGAWQPWIETGDGVASLDFRGAAAVLEPAGGISAWRVELGPGRRGDRVLVEVAGPGASSREGLEEELAGAMGVSPTEVREVDETTLRTEVADLGGVFADLR